MKSKKYYEGLNIIRIFSLVAVLFYHLNILKGGFFAVTSFFLLSGYLSCVSLLKKEKVSLKEYYQKIIFRLYIPLFIVVFLTILITSYLSKFVWINLKPETHSILLDYNNFWQIATNADYFTKNLNSPFTHLWYIAILLQFDLIFPFIFMLFQKLSQKISKHLPAIISTILGLSSLTFFFYEAFKGHIMTSYYHTFARMFPLWFGVALAYRHESNKPFIPKVITTKNLKLPVFIAYLIILCLSFIFFDSNSIFYSIIMLTTTIVTMRLISYSVSDNFIPKQSKILSFFSSISYEIYLLQYPLIFILSFFITKKYLIILLVIIFLILISHFLKFALENPRDKKYKIVHYLAFGLLCLATIFGIYRYIISEDYSKEMKELEKELAKNSASLEEKQKEYLSSLENENNDWNQTLKDFEAGEKDLANVVTNLKITGIGDSVMLGAVNNLYKTFKNGYFDAKISRTAWSVNDILLDLKKNKALGDVIIFHLGTNGDCSLKCKQQIMATCEDKTVFWLTTTNMPDVNKNLKNFAKDYSNLYIIDWETISKGHEDYFYADKIHLDIPGRKAYAEAIYNSIYEIYLKKYQDQKEELIAGHDEYLNSKITFVGNTPLLNAYPSISNKFPNTNIIAEDSYSKIKTKLEKAIKDKTLTNKVIFLFDSSLSLKKYQELINLCTDKEIYAINLSSTDLSNLKGTINILDFYTEISKHSSYLMFDKINLSKKGSEALAKFLSQYFNQK